MHEAVNARSVIFAMGQKKTCSGDCIKPFATRMRFVILMHAREDQKQKQGLEKAAGGV